MSKDSIRIHKLRKPIPYAHVQADMDFGIPQDRLALVGMPYDL